MVVRVISYQGNGGFRAGYIMSRRTPLPVLPPKQNPDAAAKKPVLLLASRPPPPPDLPMVFKCSRGVRIVRIVVALATMKCFLRRLERATYILVGQWPPQRDNQFSCNVTVKIQAWILFVFFFCRGVRQRHRPCVCSNPKPKRSVVAWHCRTPEYFVMYSSS